ncbi:TetR/AcrR family transcriptional regulator [uncultured Marivita sp.]|uniref:TetR/AcrR family transcriptional regulator n=1 Tax=uncultured Marivita sp. TaxID=888080 RepID=UPI00261860A3|nr:TetR/AcrR family transcriptional regulator [uncultured Marivita sp.]
MTTNDVKPAQATKTDAILDAATRHFSMHGFEVTKLSDIAKDAGVGVGTIYLRYEGKAELLGGVLDRAEQSFADAMNDPAIRDIPFPERFTAIISAIFKAADRERDLARLMALSAYASHAGAHETSHVLHAIKTHLQDGMDRNELRADVDLPLAARMAHGMVEGAMRAMMAEPARDPAAVIAQIAQASELWLCTPKPKG